MDITNLQHSFLQTSTTGVVNVLLVTHPNTQATIADYFSYERTGLEILKFREYLLKTSKDLLNIFRQYQ